MSAKKAPDLLKQDCPVVSGTLHHSVLPVVCEQMDASQNLVNTQRKVKGAGVWFSGSLGPISNDIQPNDDTGPWLLNVAVLAPGTWKPVVTSLCEVFTLWSLIPTLWPPSCINVLNIFTDNVAPFHFHPDEDDWQPEVISNSLQPTESQDNIPRFCKFCANFLYSLTMSVR